MRNKVKTVLLSFLIPLAIVGTIMAVAFVVCGVGICSNDCFEQYIPFFYSYYDILKCGKSFFYSLNGSMGYDFYAVFSYYLVSPLNFVMLLFPKQAIPYVVNCLIIFKMALAGGTFAVFAVNRFPKLRTSKIVLYSTIYALSGFMSGYCWNIMWLDGILLFPLVIFGMDLLLRNERPIWYLYPVFLAAQIVTSYFVGYMSCIFIFMYFFTYNFTGVKDFFRKFLRIGLTSLLAIAMSAVILLPSFWGVNSTYISGEKLPGLELYGSYAESLQTLLIGVAPIGITFDRQYANLFSTIFVLLMSFIYFGCGEIKLSSKIKNAAILLILIASMNLKPLNYVWHGMHEQTGIPNRFAFMVIFMLLVCTAQVGGLGRRAVSRRTIWISYGVLVVAIGTLCFFNRDILIMGIISAVLALVYTLFLNLKRPKTRGILISIFAYAEVVITFVYALCTCSGTLIGDYGYYVEDFARINRDKPIGFYREKLDEVYNADELYFENEMDYIGPDNFSLDTVLEYCNLMRNIGHQSIVNEGTVYDINSMSLFNTFNNYAQTDFYCKTGNTGGTNNVMYFGDNAFMDMLLGVRFYYTRYVGIVGSSYRYIGKTGEVNIYENQYTLPVAYAIPQQLAQIDSQMAANDFDNINRLSNAICGLPYYRIVNFEQDNQSEASGEIIYTYKVNTDGELVVEPDVPDMLTYHAYVNDILVLDSTRNSCMVSLGERKKGDTVRIVIKLKEKKQSNGTLYAGFAQPNAIEKAYTILSQDAIEMKAWSEDYIRGELEVLEAKDVLITVPASDGYDIKVDGESVEPKLWNNLFYILKLELGKHTIELKYTTPGFMYGLYITLAGVLIYAVALAISIIVAKAHKHKYDNISE